MADLESDNRSLRMRLAVAGREAPVRGPVAVAGPAGPPAGRLLARASLDYLDRRDGERWPFVTLPVLHLAPEAARALVDGLADLCRGAAPGFAWRSGEGGALGLQVGVPAGAAPEALLVEVGFDLSGFLAETAGAQPRQGLELALFRFPATRAALVSFAADLRAEVDRELGA